MSQPPKIGAREVTPVLFVRDLAEAMEFYTKKLLFKKLWDWGDPPDFGAVMLGSVEIFLCQRGQGHPGTWLYIFLDDADAYHARISKLGVEILQPPEDMPWGMREFQVRDINDHVLRFGHGLPCREPKLPIERVNISARIENRLAALLADLAAHKKMTIGETLEEMLLHSFEKVEKDGVASPHTEGTLDYIKELKLKHGIDYDCHANYRFIETPI